MFQSRYTKVDSILTLLIVFLFNQCVLVIDFFKIWFKSGIYSILATITGLIGDACIVIAICFLYAVVP